MIKKIFFITMAALVISFTADAQIVLQEDIDIQKGITAGTITAEIYPSELSDNLGNLFDDQDYSVVETYTDDTVIVTLEFDSPVQLSESKVFFAMGGGSWNLEIADSRTDLDNKTGSYQKLADSVGYFSPERDSVEITAASAKVLRMTVVSQSNTILFGDWSLEKSVTITSLYIMPGSPKLKPGTKLLLEAVGIDANENEYELEFDQPLIWSSDNPAVASFDDENTYITGNQLGTATITVRDADNTISGSAELRVVENIVVPNADTLHVKVAVVYQNPIVGPGDTRLHEMGGWNSPYTLINQIGPVMAQVSHGVVQYEVVEVHDDQMIFTKLDTNYMTVAELRGYYSTATGFNTLKRLAEQEGRIKFDYRGMVEYYDFYTKRQDGDIDEVWVYAHPFAGMYESQLMGKNAIWWNSPPIKDVPEFFTELLSVMGWNYERGLAEAIHSFGHRMESAVREAFGRWDTDNPDPNDWELFTRVDFEFPNKAHVGNVHYPPNGTSDYDYANTNSVTTYGPSWDSYPYLLDETRTVSCSHWNCSQLDYLRWWYSKIPHVKGKKDGVLNNWWHYFIDYQEAVEVAKTTSVVSVNDNIGESVPEEFELQQNYPNPFNPETTIKLNLDKRGVVKMDIFNVLGQHIESLVNKEMNAGSHYKVWKPQSASGVYYCRVLFTDRESMSTKQSVIKMLFLK